MKEYVLVSQGIKIYRTTDKIEAETMMKELNYEWEDYAIRCGEELENCADSEVFMYEEDK